MLPIGFAVLLQLCILLLKGVELGFQPSHLCRTFQSFVSALTLAILAVSVDTLSCGAAALACVPKKGVLVEA